LISQTTQENKFISKQHFLLRLDSIFHLGA